jgi:hypothetical protein
VYGQFVSVFESWDDGEMTALCVAEPSIIVAFKAPEFFNQQAPVRLLAPSITFDDTISTHHSSY